MPSDDVIRIGDEDWQVTTRAEDEDIQFEAQRQDKQTEQVAGVLLASQLLQVRLEVLTERVCQFGLCVRLVRAEALLQLGHCGGTKPG
eukprot:4809904-Pleurochrysis_carterae.AAC.2